MTLTPDQIQEYVTRKTNQAMTALGADVQEEWVGPGATIQGMLAALVQDVMHDMTIHISHTTEDEKRRWAVGS